MAVDLVWLAIVTFLVPVLVEYSKMKTKLGRQLGFIAGAGFMFLLAAGFETSFWMSYLAAYGPMGSALFQFIGWVMLLIGCLGAGLELLKK